MTRAEWLAICERDASMGKLHPNAFTAADRRQLIEAVKELSSVLREVRDRLRKEPAVQGREWQSLGIRTNDAIATFEDMK